MPIIPQHKKSSRLDAGLSDTLRPYAESFRRYGSRYGVDPALLGAIAMHETGRGTSRAFLEDQNAMGVSDSNGPISFSDKGGVDGSIEHMAQRLGESPIYAPARDAGTIDALAKIYAPVGAENDPRGFNKDWSAGVTNFYSQLSDAQQTAQERQGVAANLNALKGVAPDQVAQVDSLSKKFQIPFQLALDKKDDFQADADATSLSDTIHKKDDAGDLVHPITADWMSDPVNLVKSKDDVAGLQNLETSMRQHAQTVGLSNSSFDPVASGMAVEAFPHANANRIAETRSGFFQNLTGGVSDTAKARDFGLFLAGNPADDQAIIDRAMQARDQGRTVVEPGVRQFLGSTIGGAVEPIGVGLVGSLGTPATGLTLAGGDMVAVGAGSSYQRVFNAELDKGAAPEVAHVQAMKAAGFGAFVSAALAATLPGSSKLALSLSGMREGVIPTVGQVLKFIGTDAALQGTAGGAANVATNVYEGRPALEGTGESVAGQALFSILHLPMLVDAARHGSLPTSFNAASDSMQSIQKAQDSLASLDTLKAAADASKTAQRDPQAFADLAQKHLDVNQLDSSVTMDANTIASVFFQDAVTPEQRQVANEQLGQFANDVGIDPQVLNEALKTGGSVEIQKAPLVAKYGTHPVFEAIRKNISEGVEVEKERLQSSVKDMQAELGRLAQDADVPPQIKAIRTKLVAPKESGGVGMAPQDADHSLAVLMAGLRTFATKRGETLTDALQRIGLSLEVNTDPEALKKSVGAVQSKDVVIPEVPVEQAAPLPGAQPPVAKNFPPPVEYKATFTPEKVAALNKARESEKQKRRDAVKELATKEAWRRVEKGDVSDSVVSVIAGTETNLTRNQAVNRLVQGLSLSKDDALDIVNRVAPDTADENFQVAIPDVLNEAAAWLQEHNQVKGTESLDEREMARLHMEALAQESKDIEQEIKRTQIGFWEAVKKSGGIASVSSLKSKMRVGGADPLAGDLKDTLENGKVPPGVLSNKAPGLDELRGNLGGYGYKFDTVDEMIQAIRDKLTNGTDPHWSGYGGGEDVFYQSDIFKVESNKLKEYIEHNALPKENELGQSVTQITEASQTPYIQRDLFDNVGKIPEGESSSKSVPISEPTRITAKDFKQGKGRVSAFISKFLNREIPGFNIVGLKIESPQDFAAALQPLRSPYFESLKIAFLDKNNVVTHSQVLHVGTINQSVASVRDIFQALYAAKSRTKSKRVLISHNHPSGIVTPSADDIRTTDSIRQALKLADLQLVDHVITDGTQYYSFSAHSADSIRNPRLASWEATPIEKLTKVDNPETAAVILENLRQASPDARHVLYLNSKMNLVAIDRLTSKEFDQIPGLVKRVIQGAAEMGAIHIFLDGKGSPYTMKDFGTIAEKLKIAELKLIDVSDAQISSYNQSGYIREDNLLIQAAAEAGTEANPKDFEAARKAWVKKGTKSPWFKKWFGESKVVDANGNPEIVYHGTTHGFYEFTTERANVENDFGKGFYFTNTKGDVDANYAGVGPDLTSRIERLAEQINSNDEIPMEEARKQAEAKLKGNQDGRVVDSYLKMENPLIIGGKGETHFEISFDPDTELESGNGIDFLNALRDVAHGFDDVKIEELVGKAAEEISDGVGVQRLIENLKKDESIAYAMDENGDLASSELLRQAFEKMGFDGIIDRTVNKKFGSERTIGRQMEGMHEDTVHYIAFHSEQIKSASENRGTFDTNNPDIRFQGERGAVQLADGRTVVHLFQSADFSTFLHESSHVFMREMRSLVELGMADAQTIRDYRTMLEFAGWKEGKFTKDHEEKVARAFEAYLMEGKAPSVGLVDAFRRFKSWLLEIYKTVRGLNVELNDNIRQVFDRMLASEKEILDAREYYGLSKDLVDMITKDEQKRAEFLQNKEAIKAREIDRRVKVAMHAYFKAIGGREGVEKDIAAKLDKEPFYSLLDYAKGDKISLPVMRKVVGTQWAETLAKKFPRVFSDNGTLTHEGLAAQFGFSSPETLLEAFNKELPRDEAIKARTKEVIQAREAELRTTIKGETVTGADRETHGGESLAYLIAETQLLADEVARQRSAQSARFTEKAYRDAARDVILNKPVGLATRYDLFAKAERRHAKDVVKLLQQDRKVEALEARRKQLLNHALVLEAIKARDERYRIEDRYTPSRLKSALKGVENEFMAPIVAVLKRYGLLADAGFSNLLKDHAGDYDLSQIPALDDTGGLGALMPSWLQDVPPGDYRHLLNLDQFQQIDDFVQALMSFGRDELRSLENSQWDTVTKFVVASADRMNGRKDKAVAQQDANWIKKMWGKGFDWIINNTFQMPFLTDANDGFSFRTGGKLGPLGELYQKVFDSEIAKIKTIGKMRKGLDSHLKTLAQDAARITEEHGEFFDVPELSGNYLIQEMQKAGKGKWSSDKLVSILLNVGNQWNKEVLARSYGFRDAEIQAVAKFFSKDGLKAIQGVWDAINEFYPKLDETHFKLYNRHLEKVEATPITLVSREGHSVNLPGGYYPLKFDSEINTRAGGFKEEDDINQIAKRVYRQTRPSDGMTKSRVKGHSLPPKLDLSVLFNHINETSHLIHYSEVARDWHRVTMNDHWKKVFTDKNGNDSWKQVRDWLEYQVNPRPKQAATSAGRALDNLIESQKRLATVAMLGFKVKSYVANISDFFHAAQELDGFKWIARGFKEAGWSSAQTTMVGMENSDARNFIKARSDYMVNRENFIERELREGIDTLGPQKSWKVKLGQREFSVTDLRDLAIHLMVMRDKASTTVVWLGAFHKYLETIADRTTSFQEQERAAVKFADRTIQNTQPSSLKAELNSLQRERGAWRALTMFGSWMAKYGSRITNEGMAWHEGKITNKEYMRHIAYEVVGQGWFRLVTMGLLAVSMPAWTDFLMQPFKEALSWIPLVKDVPNFWTKKGVDVGEGIRRSLPVFEGADRAARLINDSLSVYEGNKGSDVLAWDLGRFGEYFLGVPALNPVKDMMRAADNATGEENFKEYH